MFKFLKFIDEYNAIILMIRSSKEEGKQTIADKVAHILSLVTKFCGMFYYLFDNIVWIANMGAIHRDIIENVLGWRAVKDMFALIKNVCLSTKGIIKLYQSNIKVSELSIKLLDTTTSNNNHHN